MLSLSLWALALLLSAPSAAAQRNSSVQPANGKLEVLEFEVGVEIGSTAFEKTYEKSLEKAQAAAESLIKNLDRRFLHSAGIKHRLGKVIIRTDANKDPLRGSIRRNSSDALRSFMDYWNRNPNEVGKSHDLAIYHVYSAPSGIAYVNTVGTRRRYALSCGRGATSWANGTAAHELGHSWNLRHNNDSGLFYEARPRDNKGAKQAGGNNHHISIMHGGGNHNIGRVSTEEAWVVYTTRQRRKASGDRVKDPGPIRPFGSYDRATCKDKRPITIDVVANDYDFNNDRLDAQLLDTVSYAGAKIALKKRSGPGGRNEIVYHPVPGFIGEDFFHYTVVDETGKTDFGAVYVACQGPLKVDTTQTEYNYDFGPPGGPVQPGWVAITPDTHGDIRWVGKAEAIDHGKQKNINLINQDAVYGQKKAVLKHKIANGTWDIVLNMGDAKLIHDDMAVKAENKLLGKIDQSKAGEFAYLKGTVKVFDGELRLEFIDRGGANEFWSLTRMSLKRVEKK